MMNPSAGRTLAHAALATLLLAGPASAQNAPLSLQPPGGVPQRAPAAAPAAPRPAGAAATAPATAPLPPVRPGSVAAAQQAPAAANPPADSAARTPVTAAAASAAAGPLSERAALERVNAYFNSFNVLSGDFIQRGADGRQVSGRLYLQKPGKLRFDYAPPSRLEIIADGTSLAIRDRKLATQDLLSLSQTPLKFLLRDRIDLARDMKLLRVTSGPDLIRVIVEDSSTVGGTSRITLDYDRASDRLRQWMVLDPQGGITTVQLANLDVTSQPNPALFRINYERILDPR